MKVEWILKFVWDEFIYGGHLLSLGAVSIVFTSALLLGIPVGWDFLMIVYLITYIIYLYDRFRGLEQDSSTNYDRSRHIKKYVKYIPIIISSSILIIIGILFYFGNWSSLVFGLLLLLFGLFYNSFFKKLTQKIVGFKNFYVAFEWALLVVFLAFYYSFPLDLAVLLLFIFIFLRWLINTIFFDIKDIKSDKEHNLGTIPVSYGKNKTLNYLHIINIFSFVLVIIGVYKNILPVSFLSLSIFYFYSFFYIQKAKNKSVNINSLSYIMVDGEYLFWSIVLFLSNIIVYG